MIRAYLSHPIRGAKGDLATRDEMEANNRRAIVFGRRLRICCARYDLDLYIPGEHDELVQEGIEHGIITAAQILQIDKHLLIRRDFLVLWVPDGFVSRGMADEEATAKAANMPVIRAEGDLAVETILLFMENRCQPHD